MKDITKYQHIIDKAIEDYPYPITEAENLYIPIRYGLQAGGKRLRPVFTLLSAEACGANESDALPCALAVEIFHNFTLLHDDVMDNSPTRRGRPSVAAKYGDNAAILSGDTMLSLAFEQLLHLQADKAVDAIKCLNHTAIEVYEGQQLDVDFESRRDVSLSEYMEMIRLKTSVLLGCAARLGVITAGGNKQTETALYDYGVNLGIAFQIMDDYLDVYGDAATFGKPIGGDILNDKKTWLRISAGNLGAEDTLNSLREQYSGDELITKVRDVYDSLYIPRLALEEIKRYTEIAMQALKKAALPKEWENVYAAIASKLTSRSK